MNFEYNCPQFVNFASAAEASPTNDVFLSSSSPAVKKEFGIFKVPNRIRAVPSKSTSVKKAVTNADYPTNTTDSVKLNTKLLSKRFSKSDGSINVPPKLQPKKRLDFFPVHKRSLSESDLRPRKKVMPTTPMCLKRTIQNVKSKKFKTTEEMELEKIAELQEQTRKHLRANEINMRRQKMKQPGNPMKDLTSQKNEKRTEVKSSQAGSDYNTIQKKLDILTKNARKEVAKKANIKIPPNIYAETMKKLNNLNKATSSSSSSNIMQDLVNPIIPQDVSEAAFERMSIKAVIKELPLKEDPGHCGLLFNPVQRKLDVRPFNFQDTLKDRNVNSQSESIKKNRATKFQAEPCHSMQTPRLVNKENEGTWSKKKSAKKPNSTFQFGNNVY